MRVGPCEMHDYEIENVEDEYVRTDEQYLSGGASTVRDCRGTYFLTIMFMLLHSHFTFTLFVTYLFPLLS